MDDVSEEYQSSWIADLLHQFPRFDLGFQPVNATFDVHDRRYLEVFSSVSFVIQTLRRICYIALCELC